MFKYVIALLLTLASSQALAQRMASNRLGLGLGFEARAQQDVNPAVYEAQMIGVGSLQYEFKPWTALLESGYEASESNTGALSIQSRSIRVMGWGRREVAASGLVSPYLTLGAGYYFDRVVSSYLGSSDERHGRRGILGVGLGVRREFEQNFFLEVEGRVHAIEDRMDAAFSGIVRLGVLVGESSQKSSADRASAENQVQ